MLTFSQRDLNTVAAGEAAYGSGRAYGDGLTYGQTLTTKFALPLPANLKKITALFNRITTPSLSLLQGIDYEIVDSSIVFKQNPFSNPLIPQRPIYGADSKITSYEIGLWGFSGEFDDAFLFNNFGYVLDLKLPSTESSKGLINALFDSHVFGPTVRILTSLVSATLGVPTVIEAKETVEVITTNPTAIQVITNAHVYSFTPGSVPVVAVGDVLSACDQLVDTVEIIDFASASAGTATIPGITIGSGMITSSYFNDLYFKNATVPLQYLGPDANGKVVVQFEISGFPGDVDLFWDSAQAAGEAAGATLANLLDTRPSPVGEPAAYDLPATINPMRFLLDNFFGNNLIGIKIKQTQVASDALGLAWLRTLREILPPHTTCIIFVNAVVSQDTYDTSTVSDVGAELLSFTSPSETISIASVDLGPIIYVEEGECANNYGDVV